MKAAFNFNCPVCGLPMVHSRLRGYHCHFEQHNIERTVSEMMPMVNRLLERAYIDSVNETFRERELRRLRGDDDRED